MIMGFIDAMIGQGHAVESVCRVLREQGCQVAARTYRAWRAGRPCVRTLTDAAVEERRTKPKLPVLTDMVGATPIVRVIGADDADTTADGLLAWVAPVAGWIAEGRRPYLFVHQPENLESPRLARMFHAAVAEAVVDLAPLPTPLPVVPATEVLGQDSLF